MENKDFLLNGQELEVNNSENEHPLPLYEAPKPPLTALEFEITEGEEDAEASVATEPEEPKAAVETVADTSDAPSVATEITEPKKESSEDEFVIPDSYVNNDKYATHSFIETPAGLRPTYLPRFTEVSDTYRMQNDPRPRIEPEKPKTEVTKKTDSKSDSEKNNLALASTEDKDIEKVVISSGMPVGNSISDETLTVLKFSTPITSETVDAAESVFEQADVTEEPVAVTEPEVVEVETAPVAEITEEEEPTPLEIPDPETRYSVMSFTADHDDYEDVEPFGSKDSPVKEQKSGEFASPIQRDSIKDRFLDSLMSIKVRLVCAALLLATVLIMDCMRFFGADPLASVGLGSVPSAAAYIDMQFAICMFLFAIPETVRACKLLFRKVLTPEIFVLAGLPVVVANNLILAMNGASDGITFAVLYGLQCFIAILSSYIRTDADFLAFKSISKNIGKNVLDKRLTRELPRENLALDGAIDEYNSKTARMFRTVFVSGFFRRSAVVRENSSNVAMMLGVGAGISLVTALVSFFLNSYSIVHAAQSFTLVFMIALPAFSVLVHKLPYKRSVREALVNDEGAFVGEDSIYESADVDVVTFEDTEIFGTEDVKVKKVYLYGKLDNAQKAMKQMYSLFTVIGGPLDFVFSQSLDRKCPSATDIIIENDGVCGMTNGHRVCAGTEDYMLRHGVTIPTDDYRTGLSPTDSTRVMYGAEDGEVYVKFLIRYSFSEEFSMLLPELKEKKIVPLIYTRDPNITGDLLKILTLGEDTIRVMKKYVPRTTEEQTYRHIDSGLVTYGDKTNAINMVLLAKKYTVLQSALAVSELVAMAVGALLAVIIAIGEISVIPETALALWHVIWCVVLMLRTKLSLGNRPDKTEDETAEENEQ